MIKLKKNRPTGPWVEYLCNTLLYVTMGHKTSHKGQFFNIEIYTSPESWINNLSIGVWTTRQYLVEIQLFKNLESEVTKQI